MQQVYSHIWLTSDSHAVTGHMLWSIIFHPHFNCISHSNPSLTPFRLIPSSKHPSLPTYPHLTPPGLLGSFLVNLHECACTLKSVRVCVCVSGWIVRLNTARGDGFEVRECCLPVPLIVPGRHSTWTQREKERGEKERVCLRQIDTMQPDFFIAMHQTRTLTAIQPPTPLHTPTHYTHPLHTPT